MKTSNLILIFLFALLGVISTSMGLNVELGCIGATARDNILAGLPLWVFGVYCTLTALFLWRKPQIGNILAVISITAAAIMLIMAIFDLSLPIIKTSCLI